MALRPLILPPAAFMAWLKTCEEFAIAVASGANLVALVGPEGSGKSVTLRVFAMTMPQQRAGLRSLGEPIAAGTTVDLLDGMTPADLPRLALEPAFDGVRVVAIRPDALEALRRVDPAARVVQVRPMQERDVRAMTEARRKFLKLPSDAFTFKAMSSLSRLCGGNPGKLDFLIGQAIRTAHEGRSPRISGGHVAQAERHLLAFIMAQQEDAERRAFTSEAAIEEMPDPSPASGVAVAGNILASVPFAPRILRPDAAIPVAPIPVAPIPVAPIPVAPIPVAPIPVAPVPVASDPAAPVSPAPGPDLGAGSFIREVPTAGPIVLPPSAWDRLTAPATPREAARAERIGRRIRSRRGLLAVAACAGIAAMIWGAVNLPVALTGIRERIRMTALEVGRYAGTIGKFPDHRVALLPPGAGTPRDTR